MVGCTVHHKALAPHLHQLGQLGKVDLKYTFSLQMSQTFQVVLSDSDHADACSVITDNLTIPVID